MPPHSAPPRVNDRPVNEAAQGFRAELSSIAWEEEDRLAFGALLDLALRHERQQGRRDAVMDIDNYCWVPTTPMFRCTLPKYHGFNVGSKEHASEGIIVEAIESAATSTEEPSDE